MESSFSTAPFTSRACRQDYRPVIISLDDHDKSIFIYAVHYPSGAILIEENVIGSKQDVAERVAGIGYSKNEIVILMEAGSHGFSTYRYFMKLGYFCRLIAPTSIPKRGKRQKTDRNDSRDNLTFYLSDSLRFVYVPDVNVEAARECLRQRYLCGFAVTKQKQRILSLLARQGQTYTLTESNWTQTHYRWLKSVSLPSVVRQLLDMMLDALARLESQVATLDATLQGVVLGDARWKVLYHYYSVLAGVGALGACTIILEGQDLSRFPHPGKLMTFTGLIPGKHSSGQHDPHLSITKAGNKYLRLALIGAAKYYRDRRFMLSTRQILTHPKPLQEFLERCQNRLHGRYRHLCKQGKHSNKAKAAVAREMCTFIWELAVKVIPRIEKTEPEKAAA